MRTLRILLALVPAALSACAGQPVGESPIEAAQRRLPKEMPLIVAEGCYYRRNLLAFNHYLKVESRELAKEGAQDLIAAFKEKGVPIQSFAVPLMCASSLPPRLDDKEGRFAESIEKEEPVEKLKFPIALNEVVGQDQTLKAAYEKLFAPCDYKRYRKEDLYDCPLLKPEEATLLKARLKTGYVLALSIAADRASAAHKTSTFTFGLLLGVISFPEDAATARVRLIDLTTGNLVWSSFPGEFSGDELSSVYYTEAGSRSRYDELEVKKGWAKRMIKSLFEKQR